MLNHYLLLLTVTLLSWNLTAQCPPTHVTLLSQAEVDAYVALYPTCTMINGNLSIGSTSDTTDITDLSGLSPLTSIGGFLRIRSNPLLENLDGLNAITSINGFLRIRNNSLLTNLNELTAITSINGFLRIRNNPLLTNITGVENIDPNSIVGLSIRDNTQLSSCAIENLCAYLDVEGNTALISNNSAGCNNRSQVETACSTCPFGVVTFISQAEVDAFAIAYPDCTQLTGSIKIGNGLASTNINDLSGLSNLVSIGSNLTIFFNDNLSTLEGLDALATVGGNFSIFRNNALSDMTGLNSLTTTGGTLSFFRNDGLINMNGLNALSKIGGNLSIKSNDALTSLDGMETLSEIDGFLAIRFNTSLTDIQGLVNIDPTSINRLYITNNPLLSGCAIDNICAYLAEEEDNVQIANNALGCLTRVQVENACSNSASMAIAGHEMTTENNATLAQSVPVNIQAPAPQIKLYPNPTSGLLQVRNVDAQRIQVFSPQGQRVVVYEAPSSTLDISTLPAGVYYFNFLTTDGSFTERVVKVD